TTKQFAAGVPGTLASGANKELNSSPAEAVESLEMIVLLTTFTASASSSDTPPPSHPATLFAMMLLVALTEFHVQRNGNGIVTHVVPKRMPCGKLITSLPFTCCSRRPPPLPASAALPRIRLALIVRPGPVPSLGATVFGGGTQSLSVFTPQ